MVIPFRQLLAPGVEPAGGPPVGIVHIPKLLPAAFSVQPAVDPQGKGRQRFRTLRQQDHRLIGSQRLQRRLHGLVATFLQKYALPRIQQGNPLQLPGQSCQTIPRQSQEAQAVMTAEVRRRRQLSRIVGRGHSKNGHNITSYSQFVANPSQFVNILP